MSAEDTETAGAAAAGSEPRAGAGAAGSDGRIAQLTINSPYSEPSRHWQFNPAQRKYELMPKRRPAGYQTGDLAFKSLDLANKIRPRVRKWRQDGYPGVTRVTKRLLEHWDEREGFANRQLFFAQMEAAETLIWLTEAPEADKVGVRIPSDGSDFTRVCSKMATGSGKTVVMAMLVAWQILNKVEYRNDTRYSKNVLVIAPGLTVRSRLKVLDPQGHDNYYQEFRIVPPELRDKLRQGRLEIRNWHALQWADEAKVAKRKGVDKRGPLSDEAWARSVLGDVAAARNLLVINDEAHHAWRVQPERSTKDFSKADLEEATRWVEGLDRIHRVRGILACHDFTATPFIPAKKGDEELFEWVVSDFGLNDAIESGLVKTPRVVVRDNAMPDASTYRSRMYHLYNENAVKGELNRKAAEAEPLPDLVHTAYQLLGHDWAAAHQAWRENGHPVPPVMISVVNRTETAARVRHAFDSGFVDVPGLCDPETTLHIDSKVLSEAEETETPIAELPGGPGAAGRSAAGGASSSGSEDGETGGEAGEASAERAAGEAKTAPKLTKKQRAELLRRQVDTVGVEGEPGEQIRHVISVAMLSEGWDAKTVTHIMGLRAFTSQLLCEQVIGRGLRRTSYEVDAVSGLFEPEYVNIFGVPFEFMPTVDDPAASPEPPKPKTEIRSEPAKIGFEISFPNLVRVERVETLALSLDKACLTPLELDASKLPTEAVLAETLQGAPDESRTATITAPVRRLQAQLFDTAERLHDYLAATKPLPTGNRALQCIQLVDLLDEFIGSGLLRFTGGADPDLAQMVSLHQQRIFEHLATAITARNTERLEPVFDDQRAILSTADMAPWWTGKKNGLAAKSHVNRCVYDSALEQFVAQGLDGSDLVEAWAKNDHLGFEVSYVHGGVTRRYIPDFIVRLAGNRMLVLEVKGDPLDIDRSKERYLRDWITAVNGHGGFGTWSEAMYTPNDDLAAILAGHTQA